LYSNVSEEDLNSTISMFIEQLHGATRLIENGNVENLIRFIMLSIGDLMFEYRKYYTLFGELTNELADEYPLLRPDVQKIRNTVPEKCSEKE
jgi:hypothetical protein